MKSEASRGVPTVALVEMHQEAEKQKPALEIRRESVAESSVSEGTTFRASSWGLAQGTVASPGPAAGRGHESNLLLMLTTT